MDTLKKLILEETIATYYKEIIKETDFCKNQEEVEKRYKKARRKLKEYLIKLLEEE